MQQAPIDTDGEPIDTMGDDGAIVKPSALDAIARSEISMQLDAAHRWPRSPERFLSKAKSLVTLGERVAQSCMYSLPRAGKMIQGPSVRLAEICAGAWKNLHVGARVIDILDDVVVAQSVAWDIENNVRITIEVQRSILDKENRRFQPDMIRVTGLAATSIALRNSVFRVIPRAYIDQVYEAAKGVAVGNAKTLIDKRDEWLGYITRMGVTPERVFGRLDVQGPNDITLEHIALMQGIANAIRSNELDIDEAFPPVPTAAAASPATSAGPTAAAAAPEGQRVNIGTGKRGAARATAKTPPAPAATNASSAPAEPTKAPKPATAPAAPGAAPKITIVASAVPDVVDAGEIGGAPPPVSVADLLGMLAVIDEAWRAPGLDAKVAGWTEIERWAAEQWAHTVIDNRPMAEQLNRPPHTLITRQPGEDDT